MSRWILGRPARTRAGLLVVLALTLTSTGSLAATFPAAAVASTDVSDSPSLYVPETAGGEAVAAFDAGASTSSEAWIEVPGVDTDRDGQNDRLLARIQVPENAGPDALVPVVIAMSPYYGGIFAVPQHNPYTELWDPSQPKGAPSPSDWMRPGDGDYLGYDADGSYWLQRGFAFARVSALGTDRSTGCPQMMNREEAASTSAMLDWFAHKDGSVAYDADGAKVSTASWSSGRVGMTGTSYDGSLPLVASTTGNDALKAIAPMAPVSNLYDYYRVGGGLYGPEGYAGEDLDNFVDALRPRGDHRCDFVIQDFLDKQDRTTGDYNDFWGERNLFDVIGNVKTPTLIGHGLNDLNVRVGQSTDWYEALKARGVPTKLYLHQFDHVDLAWVGGSNWQDNLNAWFTHYLFGVDNGAQDDLGVRIQKQDGSWYDDDAWPAKNADPVRFFAAAGGAGVGSLQPLSRDGRVASEALVDDSSISLNDLVAADESTHRLLYSTGALADELRISGTATAQLSVAIDRLAANITMALVDVAPDGSRHLITRAWTDPQNRTDIRTTEAVVPGQTYDLALRFVPTEYRIPAGHALGVMVASSDTDTSLLPAPGTTLTVDTSQTFVDVPVAGGEQLVSTLVEDIAHPTLSVAAASVREGERQTVSGAGFAPGVDLTVSMDADGVLPATVRTSAEGTLSAVFDLPAGSAGERTVVAGAGRAEVARAAFIVDPAPTPTPTPSPSDGSGAGAVSGAGVGTGGTGAAPTSAPATGSPAGALAATGTDAAPAGPVTAALLLLCSGAVLIAMRRARIARRAVTRR